MKHIILLKFYEEDTCLRDNFSFLQQLIRHWNHAQLAFRVGIDSWYQPTKEDIYFITGLFRREDQPEFPKLPIDVATKMQPLYVQRYVIPDIIQPIEFQVGGGQLQIDSFGREEVRCLPLIVMTLAHYTYDGYHISFSLMYYVDIQL